jgi:hypothetical protein
LQSSRAVQFTVVLPTGNILPEGGLQTIVTFVSQSSVAVTVYVTGVPAPVGEQLQVTMLPGQLITGG